MYTSFLEFMRLSSEAERKEREREKENEKRYNNLINEMKKKYEVQVIIENKNHFKCFFIIYMFICIILFFLMLLDK